MRWWLLVLVVDAGCVRPVALRIDLGGVPPVPGPNTILPKFVELQHQTGGWVRVDVEREGDAVRTLTDGSVVLATADLPPGRYEAVRFAYLVARADVPDRTRTLEPYDAPFPFVPDGLVPTTAWAPAEALILQSFCLDGSDPLSSIVVQVARSGADALPTRITLEAPPCVEDRDRRW